MEERLFVFVLVVAASTLSNMSQSFTSIVHPQSAASKAAVELDGRLDGQLDAGLYGWTSLYGAFIFLNILSRHGSKSRPSKTISWKLWYEYSRTSRLSSPLLLCRATKYDV